MRLAFRRLPIRLRLTIAFGGVLTAVLAVGGLVLYFQFRSDFDNLTGANLSSRAADAAALVASGEPHAALTRSQERLAQVFDARGRLVASTPALSRSRLLTPEQARRAARGRLRIARVQVPAGATTVSAHAAHAFGRPLAVAVAEPLDRRDQALDRLAELLLIVGPFALVLATYAGYQVAGAALGPVERMRARAEQITERDTAERLPVPATHDEIEALGHTLNALLGRLDEAVTRERWLLSEASHELRTPLTVLLTEVQVALRGDHDPDEMREALESVGHEAKRLSRLADDLLTLARADAGRLPVRPERLDAKQVLAAAAQRAGAAAAASGRSVTADVKPGIGVCVDPDRAAQALDNLVANALAYGAGDITLAATVSNGAVELHVTDHGGGFPDGFVEHAFERFRRGHAARTGEGAGLGLPIVATIAQAHGGEAGARNLPGGGADVWLSVPAG
jgi:signal transduction histidine kinase